MKKAAIKLTMLSIILLASISGIVLGAVYNNTNMSGENGTYVANDTVNVTGGQTTSDVANGTVNVTDQTSADNASGIANNVNDTTNVTVQTGTDSANVTSTEPGTEATVVSTPENIVDTSTPAAPQDTAIPQPVQTPKSPGFESVVSVALLLLAMYVSKRK